MMLPVSREHPAGALHYRAGENGPLVLRPLALSDAGELTRAIEASLPELRRFMAWAHLDVSEEGQLARLKTVVAEYQAGRALGMGLFEEKSGKLLVSISLEPRVPHNPRGWEIGYWTRTDVAGRGLCTLAVQIMSVYAFELLGADRVQILTSRSNVASARVAEKAGYVLEAKVENVVARPSHDEIHAGYVADPITIVWAMVPRTYTQTRWASSVRSSLVVENLLGQQVTGWF